MYKSKKFQMFDYGSPEKNKEHYGNVSIMITLLVASIIVALILCYFVSSRISLCEYFGPVIVVFLRNNFSGRF